jgi:hypothetical protein
MSEFIREVRDGGELEKLEKKWLGGNMDGAEMPDIESLSGENGTLTLRRTLPPSGVVMLEAF